MPILLRRVWLVKGSKQLRQWAEKIWTSLTAWARPGSKFQARIHRRALVGLVSGLIYTFIDLIYFQDFCEILIVVRWFLSFFCDFSVLIKPTTYTVYQHCFVQPSSPLQSLLLIPERGFELAHMGMPPTLPPQLPIKKGGGGGHFNVKQRTALECSFL